MTHSPDMSRVCDGLIVESKVSRQDEKQVGDCRGQTKSIHAPHQICPKECVHLDVLLTG